MSISGSGGPGRMPHFRSDIRASAKVARIAGKIQCPISGKVGRAKLSSARRVPAWCGRIGHAAQLQSLYHDPDLSEEFSI